MTKAPTPIEKSIEEYSKIIKVLRENNQLDKYIEYAVFPNFKNLENGARIDFHFPLTAIVGPNGSGKTSILHALYGMPYRFSTSRFWFSTNLDPIEEGRTKGPNRYFYSHLIREISKCVETKKIRRKRNESYWEPARVSKPDGMQEIPEAYPQSENNFRAADRWYPTFREPIYISFKYQFSAFDRAFHINNTGIKLTDRIEKVKKSAKRLNKVVTHTKKTYKPGGVEAVFEHRFLMENELEWTNHILGKRYIQARYIEHRLYEKERGTSVIFQTESGQYSEAFAGSGELAVVNLVTKLINGKQNSLVLLDEPETSLHPGAQECLIRFLMWSIMHKRYQIVVSTHSPTITRLLPQEALLTLLETDEGRTAISPVEHPYMAFNRIGHIPENKKLVIVEDKLLLKIIEVALDHLDAWKRDSIKVVMPSSGGDEVFKYLLPMHAKEDREVHYILDGDKAPKIEIDSEKLKEKEAEEIFKKLKQAYDCEPLHLKSNDKEGCLAYIARAREKVHYLDAECPEVVFLELLGVADSHTLSNQDAKDRLVALLDERKLGSDASTQHTLFNFHLREAGKNSHVEHCIRILDKICKN